MVAGQPHVRGLGMGLSLDNLRLKAARILVLALWLHLPQVKQATGAVVNISTGGSLKNTIEERIAPALAFSPEMCSLNMGSMNFSFHPFGGEFTASLI